MTAVREFLRGQHAAWCRGNPLGVVYSMGEATPCEGEPLRREREAPEGLTLRVGIFRGDDFGYDCDGSDASRESYSGFILELLRDVLRFKVELVTSTSWGRFHPSDRTWNGLVGLLAKNATDVTVCHWTTSKRLVDVADFLFSSQETTEAFVYLPQNLPLTRDVFLGTFSGGLWVFFLLSLFLLAVSFKFSTFVHSSVRPDHEPWSWDEVALWAVAAVCQQSYSRHPRGSSCRTMFLIGYSISYLLYTGFAAGITSLLALQDHQSRLSFEDVVAMDLRLVLHEDEFYFDWLQRRVDSGSLNLSLERSEVGDLAHVFERIRRPNFVGFGSTSTILNYLSRKVDAGEREDFLVTQVPHSRRLKAFLVRRGFPFKRTLDYWLLRLRETGLLDLGRRRFLKTQEAANYRATRWLSADLRNVRSAFGVLAAGWLLSGAVLWLEVLGGRRR